MSWECGDSIPLLNDEGVDGEINCQNVSHKRGVPSKSMRNQNGIHWVVAAAFIVADMAGGGVVTMPIALLKAGSFLGSIVMITVAVCFCYTAHLLGENWLIMRKRWPIYNQHCRKPYPEMAFRSIGQKARLFTAATLHIMLFGVSVVYLLLSAKIINGLVSSSTGIHAGECNIIIILTIFLFPVTLLKSPQDFWLAVVLAMVTTVISVTLIIIGILSDSSTCKPMKEVPEFSTGEFVLSLGIFMFAFGGHGVFPTICHDMKRPAEFTKSSLLGFFGVCLLYLPVTFLGYDVYGDSLTESVISSIQNVRIQQGANFFIAAHCILTLTIVINPLNQELEHKLKLPHEFGYQRVVIRAIVLGVVTIFALSVPSFGPLLNLIGGTTVAMTSGVLPCLFNMCLRAKSDDVNKSENLTLSLIVKRLSSTRLMGNVFVIGLALIFGVITTTSAMKELYVSEMSAPCWSENYRSSISEAMHCCGHFRNVSVNGLCHVH